MAKTPEELKLRRVQEKLDGTQAMVEYKKAEGTARDLAWRGCGLSG